MTHQEEEQFRANRFEIVSRLADDLAHEIKNPLNAIIINLEVLKVRVAGGDSEAATDRAVVIEQETRKLHELIDRLLQLLRPSREEATSLPLAQALDEVVPLVALQARLARNTFSSSCSSSVFVSVPRDVFKFALLNVLTALHERLGEDGGSIDMECGATDDAVRISIRARARAGLAPEMASFTRAVRLADELLEPYGGTVDTADGLAVVLPRGAPV